MNDRYEIRAKIGVGGMGAVYRAYDNQLKREVAVKRLHSQEGKPEESRKTAEFLIQEAGHLSKLQHPNIVSVYDCGIDADGGYVVMELVTGETLNETIKRGALPLKDFNSVVEQALEGLIAAQDEGMLHRDLKPTNVMIRWFPSGSFQLKLLDFGLAKVSDQPSLQTIDHNNSIMGSIYFMSPEQFERKPLDARTDLYSLGCLLYYCLAGRFPFRGKTAADVMAAHLEHDVAPLRPIRPDIPGPISDWVLRMMSRACDERPHDARAAMREYLDLLASLPKKAPGTSTAPVPAPVSPHPRLVVGAPALSPDTGSQRISTASVLRPLHRANKKTGLILSLSTAAAILLAGGAYLLWAPRGDSNTGVDREEPVVPETEGGKSVPFTMPAEFPDADVETVLLPFGAPWSYPEPGTPLPEDWIAPEFDDAAWLSGPSPIGYGDDGLKTEIDVSSFGKARPISLSYRTRFEVATLPPAGSYADIQVIADDGALVFLNGVEVARIGLRAGEISDTTATVRKMETENEGWLSRARFPASFLREGENVLAIRVHQTGPTSSDSWLDAKLVLCKSGTPESPDATLPRAEGFAEIVPTAETKALQWEISTTELKPGWEITGLPPGAGRTAKGMAASESFPGTGPRFSWPEENIWMTRLFWVGDKDLENPGAIALKVLHSGSVIVYLNGRFAGERLGSSEGYVVVPLTKNALATLQRGQGRLSVHAAGGQGAQAVDVGLIRLDRRVTP